MIRPGARVRLLKTIYYGAGGRRRDRPSISAGTEGEVIALTRTGLHWIVRFGRLTAYCRAEELEVVSGLGLGEEGVG